MKSKLLVTLLAVTLAITSLTGCGANSNNVAESTESTESTETPTATLEETEAPHEHAYTEKITTAPTCLEAGVKTFTCECGDTYTEELPATGHIFENYVSNNDATYTADGTETAKCNNCDETDTRTAEGSMLTYTYTDMDATKFAKSTVNVRSLPNTDGEKLGGLSQNDEVKVTGKCNETGWYRISYNDSIAYVSDSYLVDEKVEVAQASAPAQPKAEQTVQEQTQTQTNTQTTSNGLSIVLRNGYSVINTTVSSYEEAVAAFKAVGIEPWVTHEENGKKWCYAILNHVGISSENHHADFDTYVYNNFHLYDWGNRLGTKDGRVYVDDVRGGSWSIRDAIERDLQ